MSSLKPEQRRVPLWAEALCSFQLCSYFQKKPWVRRIETPRPTHPFSSRPCSWERKFYPHKWSLVLGLEWPFFLLGIFSFVSTEAKAMGKPRGRNFVQVRAGRGWIAQLYTQGSYSLEYKPARKRLSPNPEPKTCLKFPNFSLNFQLQFPLRDSKHHPQPGWDI